MRLNDFSNLTRCRLCQAKFGIKLLKRVRSYMISERMYPFKGYKMEEMPLSLPSHDTALSLSTQPDRSLKLLIRNT